MVPCLLGACIAAEAPGFEVVRVPASAYLTPDGAARAASDAGTNEAKRYVPQPRPARTLPTGCFDLHEGRRTAEPAPRRGGHGAPEVPEVDTCEDTRPPNLKFDPLRTGQIRQMLDRSLCCYATRKFNDY